MGIGASAGGLEAFSALLKHLPLDTGMGFVLVQHLDPVHDSALTQLLGRETSLPVCEVTNNLRVEPNHVYVIPPNTPAVLINADLQILQFRGPTAAYLELPTGKANFDLLKMARTGLLMPLRCAINTAKKENATARKAHIRIEENGRTRAVDLEVIPLKNLPERCILVVFKDVETSDAAVPTSRDRRRSVRKSADADRAPRAAESRRIALLEADLAEMRDYAQSS